MADKKFPPVSARVCDNYGEETVMNALRAALTDIGFDLSSVGGKTVCLKPNLLMKSDPDGAVTTHPSVVRAAAKLLTENGAKVVVAESGGGSYTPESFANLCRACGLTDALKDVPGAEINSDCSSVTLPFDGMSSKLFEVLKPLAECDVIFDLCKLKTHGLTGMTCAVKNMFGAVPGVKKFETHARFGHDAKAFMNYVVDVCGMLMSGRGFVAVCDAVECMEGNGPSGGTPKHVGALLASESPYCLDMIAADVAGLTDCAQMLPLYAERGLCPASAGEIEVAGDDISRFRSPFRRAEAAVGHALTSIPGFMKPRPRVDPDVCRGCGECAENCPRKTIVMIKKNGKRKAKIRLKNCIRCYCCQELCRFRAVEVKRLPLAEIANRIGFMK